MAYRGFFKVGLAGLTMTAIASSCYAISFLARKEDPALMLLIVVVSTLITGAGVQGQQYLNELDQSENMEPRQSRKAFRQFC